MSTHGELYITAIALIYNPNNSRLIKKRKGLKEAYKIRNSESATVTSHKCTCAGWSDIINAVNYCGGWDGGGGKCSGATFTVHTAARCFTRGAEPLPRAANWPNKSPGPTRGSDQRVNSTVLIRPES